MKTISKNLFDNVQVKPSLEYKVQLKRLKFEKTSPVLIPPTSFNTQIYNLECISNNIFSSKNIFSEYAA